MPTNVTTVEKNSDKPSKLTQKDVDIQAAFAVKQIDLCGRKSIIL